MCGERLGLGIISGFCYLPAAVPRGAACWPWAWSSSGCRRPRRLTARTHILAEWPWMCHLTSRSLWGLMCEQRSSYRAWL